MGSGGGGGGGASNTTNVIRYAPYIEAHHTAFLDRTANHVNWILDNNATYNPYNFYDVIPVENGFFGIGYTLASFPSLFDVYGKFVAGLDIEALWAELMDSTSDSPQANNFIAAESVMLDEELESKILPKYLTGMRDLNAVMSSSFVIGKALLYDTKQKMVEKFSAELKWKLVGIAQDRWKAHIAWNAEAVSSYAKLFELYFDSKEGVTRTNMEFLAKKALWPLDILDYQRANLGALTGATKSTSSASSSKGSKAGGVVGGIAGGAAMGATVTGGNPYGALIGGIIGGIASLF